jgi:D-threonate/D-erythronate kinase
MMPVRHTNQKLRHAIIADDLTGAMDAAAAFAGRGFTVEVVLDPRRLRESGARVVALCTHSRHDAPGVARRKVSRACVHLRKNGRSLLYKKLDSTGQGNIVAEVEAARDAGGFPAALVCPAHPTHGRTVRRSVLRAREGGAVNLNRRFRSQGLLQSGSIGLPISLAKAVRAIGRGHRFLAADAASERDLEILVRAALRSRHRVLLAGSAGMAGVLAKLLIRRGARPPWHGRLSRRSNAGTTVPLKTLVIAGSNNPVTRRQLKMLVARTGAALLPLNRLTNKNAAAALAGGRNVVIRAPVHRQSDRVILRRLGTLTPLFRANRIGALLLTGGDTASLVCRCLRPLAIAIGGEIVPGLAWGRFIGGAADGLAVCTKPGGFGIDQSLVRAVRFLAAA